MNSVQDHRFVFFGLDGYLVPQQAELPASAPESALHNRTLMGVDA
jgi:hypothetical protein